MKRTTVLLVLAFAALATVLNGQITTRVITPDELSKVVKYYDSTEPTFFDLPFVDVEKLKKEDEKLKGQVDYLRYGQAIDVNFGLKEGKWTICNGGYKWRLGVKSKEAVSLDFTFDSFYLPEGAELYIYNKDITMVMGALTSANNNKNERLSTFSIQGEVAIVELYEPPKVHGLSRLHLSQVIHGYINFENGNVGSPGSLTCTHINANCAQGNGVENEKRAVAMLVTNGIRFCSGTLLNNACNNLRPNLLTAFHCLDGLTNGGVGNTTLDGDELARLATMLFIFHYKTTGCSGNSAPINICFEGAQVLTSQLSTDMVLLELTTRPSLASNVSYAGWSNSANTPAPVICISHPQGNPMKLAVDDNGPDRETINRGTFGNFFSWSARFDRGATEPGSSGSALFNPQNQVIGQLFGSLFDQGGNVCTGNRKIFGRLDESWNTIRPHLTDDPSVATTNTSGIPSFSITNNLCSNVPLSLANMPPNMSLFGGSLVGANITDWFSGIEPQSGFNGLGHFELQFKPNGITCNDPLIIRKDFWVGPPLTPQVTFMPEVECYGWLAVDNPQPTHTYNWVITRGQSTYYVSGPIVYLSN